MSAAHAVQLRLLSGGPHIVASCRCLPHNRHMGRTVTYEDTRRLFNDPTNHAVAFDPQVDGLRPWWVRWGSWSRGVRGVTA